MKRGRSVDVRPQLPARVIPTSVWSVLQARYDPDEELGEDDRWLFKAGELEYKLGVKGIVTLVVHSVEEVKSDAEELFATFRCMDWSSGARLELAVPLDLPAGEHVPRPCNADPVTPSRDNDYYGFTIHAPLLAGLPLKVPWFKAVAPLGPEPPPSSVIEVDASGRRTEMSYFRVSGRPTRIRNSARNRLFVWNVQPASRDEYLFHEAHARMFELSVQIGETPTSAQ